MTSFGQRSITLSNRDNGAGAGVDLFKVTFHIPDGQYYFVLDGKVVAGSEDGNGELRSPAAVRLESGGICIQSDRPRRDQSFQRSGFIGAGDCQLVCSAESSHPLTYGIGFEAGYS